MRLSAITVLILFGALASCTSTLYPGPRLADDKVSRIAFHSSGPVSVESASIDGIRLDAMASNAEVLPGQHRLEAVYHLDLEKCASSEEYCEAIVARGICRGSISTLPGRAYLAAAVYEAGGVKLRLSAKGYFDFIERSDEPSIGYASCTESSRYETERRRRR